MAKFCKNCGEPLEEGDRFCEGCGAVLDAPAETQPAYQAPPEQGQYTPPEQGQYTPPEQGQYTPPEQGQYGQYGQPTQAYGQPAGGAAPGVPPGDAQPAYQAPPEQGQYAQPEQGQYGQYGQPTQAYGQPAGDAALGVPPPGAQPAYQAQPQYGQYGQPQYADAYQPQQKKALPKWLLIAIIAAAAVVAVIIILNVFAGDSGGKDKGTKTEASDEDMDDEDIDDEDTGDEGLGADGAASDEPGLEGPGDEGGGLPADGPSNPESPENPLNPGGGDGGGLGGGGGGGASPPGSDDYEYFQGDADYPDNEFTRMIPKPNSPITGGVVGDEMLCVFCEGMSRAEAEAYGEQLKKAGFSNNGITDEYDGTFISYGDNGSGYIAYVTWNKDNGGIIYVFKNM